MTTPTIEDIAAPEPLIMTKCDCCGQATVKDAELIPPAMEQLMRDGDCGHILEKMDAQDKTALFWYLKKTVSIWLQHDFSTVQEIVDEF